MPQEYPAQNYGRAKGEQTEKQQVREAWEMVTQRTCDPRPLSNLMQVSFPPTQPPSLSNLTSHVCFLSPSLSPTPLAPPSNFLAILYIISATGSFARACDLTLYVVNMIAFICTGSTSKGRC